MSRTFVLVPGLWVGAWAWHPVARHLEGRGYRVIVPTLPGTTVGEDPNAVSLADATHQLVSVVEPLDEVVLVAHDWSGYPVTAAAHRVPERIARLVYWSAFAPAADESLLDTIPAEDTEALTAAEGAADGTGVLVPAERWRTKFVQTAPEAVRDLTYSLLRPAPWSYLSQSLSGAEARVPDAPVTYLAGTRDMALNPGEWATKHAARLGVTAVGFDACHAAHLTDPEIVADQLLLAAAPAPR